MFTQLFTILLWLLMPMYNFAFNLKICFGIILMYIVICAAIWELKISSKHLKVHLIQNHCHNAFTSECNSAVVLCPHRCVTWVFVCLFLISFILVFTGFPRILESPWKYLIFFLLNSRSWKYLKTGQVLESPWIYQVRLPWYEKLR